MKQEEYIKTIIYNDRLINLGLDDAGQTYFIEYAEDGQLKEECVGSYNTDYERYIEWRFGEPEINCPIYHNVVTSDTEFCNDATRGFCSECRKAYDDIAWDMLQKRREEFAKWLEENKNA